MLAILLPLLLAPHVQDTRTAASDYQSDQLRGRVLDAEGAPVAGATVRVEPSRASLRGADGPTSFLEAGLQQLSAVALPHGKTGDNGTFQLLLNEDLRRLGVVAGAHLALVVEKPGFIPWFGALGISLGRAGTIEARLTRAAPEDVIRGRVVPPPGHEGSLAGRVVVTRIEADMASSLVAEPPQVAVVAADGSFSFMRRAAGGPPLATPFLGTGEGFHIQAGIEGFAATKVWCARDATSCELALAPAQKLDAGIAIEPIPGLDPAAEAHVTLVDPLGLRWRRTLRATDTIKYAGWWNPVSLEVPGACGVVLLPGAKRDPVVRLRALPAADVLLRVQREDGTPLAGAAVEIVDFEQVALLQNRLVPLAEPGGAAVRQRTGAGGTLSIPRRLFARPALLRVRADGHETLSACLSRLAADPTVVLKPKPSGTIRFAARFRGGKPAAGASVLLSNGARDGTPLFGGVPRTDADGTWTARLPVGKHTCMVFAPGSALEPIELEVVRDQEAVVNVELRPAATGALHVVDAEGKPLPRQIFLHSLWPVAGREPATSACSITDADGRARIEGIPRDGGPVQLLCASATQAPRVVMLDPEDRVTEVTLETGVAEVLIRVPPRVERVTFHSKTGNVGPSLISAGDVRDYRLFVAPGDVWVSARSPWLPMLSADLTLEAGKSVVLDWRMETWPEAVLELALKDGSPPPAGVRVVEVEKDEGPLRSGYPIPFDLGALWRRPGDPPGLLRFRVPPKGRFVVELQHETLAGQRIEITDGKLPERRIVLDARGSPLTLRFKAGGGGRAGFASFRGSVVGPGGALDPVIMSVPLTGIRDGILEVRWPAGLAPGAHVLSIEHFEFAPAEWTGKEKAFTVVAGKPAVVDFTGESEGR